MYTISKHCQQPSQSVSLFTVWRLYINLIDVEECVKVLSCEKNVLGIPLHPSVNPFLTVSRTLKKDYDRKACDFAQDYTLTHFFYVDSSQFLFSLKNFLFVSTM